MSYTLQWANYTSEVWKRGNNVLTFGEHQKFSRQTPFDESEKNSFLTPALSLQEDVLFPNSLAAAFSSEPDQIHAVGCKGHQLDNEFPLELRTPACLPLLQYPTRVNSKSLSLEEHDICSLPVLNWEAYVRHFKESLNKCQRFVPTQKGVKRKPPKKFINQEPSDDEGDEELSTLDYVAKKWSKRPPRRPTRRKMMENIFSTNINLEKLEEAIPAVTESRKKCKEEKEKFSLPPPVFVDSSAKLKISTVCRYKNVPSVRVQGTWNYMYNQKGACEWTNDSSSKESRILLVGKGSNLRAVRLVPANPFSMISYNVDHVWDEERPTTNTNPHSPEFLDDTIFQISAHREESFVGVRRGVSIDLYNTVETPSFLSSIPIRGYGNIRSQYVGYSHDTEGDNLKFTTFDLNPYNPCQVVTLDQNFIIQFHDVVAEKSSKGVYALDDTVFNVTPITPEDRHQFTLNHTGGLTFASHSAILYFYYNSKVYLYDRRVKYKIDNVVQRPDFHPLFDLGNDKASLALSDQHYFATCTKNKILERISCLQRSHNPNYYYVGTSQRLFLMDWRVPKYPVIKLSHGMRSPITYIDTLSDKNYEIVVAGSQNGPETFSAALDFAHVSCEDRPECEARNPILLSYPRHLSNSRDFLRTVKDGGQHFAWESESCLVEGHCHAWCTGLTVCPVPKPNQRKSINPSSSCVISTNCFGDVFYQEWAPRPIPNYKKYNCTDYKWTSFVERWKQSMSSNTLDETGRQAKSITVDNDVVPLPLPPTNCSAVLEPKAPISLEKLKKMKDFSFNPFKINRSHYKNLRKNLKSVQENAEILKRFKGSRARKLIEIWEKDWKCKNPVLDPIGNDDEITEPHSPVHDDAEETTLNPTDSWRERMAPSNADVGEVADMAVEIKKEIEEEGDDFYKNCDLSDVEIIDPNNEPVEEDDYDIYGLFRTQPVVDVVNIDNEYYTI